jgi:hypothetical protein
VNVVARREGLDLLESLRGKPPSQHEVAPQRRLLGHERGEPHPGLKRDPRLLRDDGDGAGLGDHLEKTVEEPADGGLTAGEQRLDVEGPARVPLIPRREPFAAPRAAPQSRLAAPSIRTAPFSPLRRRHDGSSTS